MCSLEQMKALMADQNETLARQRNEERGEDLIKFSEMIKNNVKEEIKEAIEPISKRQEEFEIVTTKQYNDMAKELANINQCIAGFQPNQNKNQNPPTIAPATYYPPSTTCPPGPPTHPPATPTLPRSRYPPPSNEPSLMSIIEIAERTVGFKPLHVSDIDEICRIHDTDDAQYAMKLLVIEYLRFEMKNHSTQLENIVKVFPPARPDWNPLYAEFDTRRTTSTVYRYTRFLRDEEHKVFPYIPHMFYDQFDHLSNIAHKYRMAPDIHKTKIKFGRSDMYLQVIPPGSHAWQMVQVHNLPPRTSRQQPPDLSVSPSLAPGRIRLVSHKRQASASPQSLRNSKAAKSGPPEHAETPAGDADSEPNVDESSSTEHTASFL